MTSRLITGLLREEPKSYSKFLLEEFYKSSSTIEDREKRIDFIKQRFYRFKVLLRYAGIYSKESENLFLKGLQSKNDKAKNHLITCLSAGIEKFRQAVKQDNYKHPEACYPFHPKSEWYPKEVAPVEADSYNTECVASIVVQLFVSSQESKAGKLQEEKIKEDLIKAGKTPEWINKTISEAKALDRKSYEALIEDLSEALKLR